MKANNIKSILKKVGALWIFAGLLLFGCRSTQPALDDPFGLEEPPVAKEKVAMDTTEVAIPGQLQTELKGDKLVKRMSYPYLQVRFKQNDTEVEMMLDPSMTNLVLDLKRSKDVEFDVQHGDSMITQHNRDKPGRYGKSTSPADSLHVSKFDNDEDLTDDIIREIQLAQQLFYDKDFEGALKVLNQSIAKKPTASAYALGGSIHFFNGEMDQAVQAWESALNINPQIPEIADLVRKYKKTAE